LIIDKLFELLGQAAILLIRTLPTGTYDPSPWAGPMSSVIGAYKAFSSVMPVTAIMAAILFGLAVTNSLMVYRLLNYAIKHIPFIGG
jgi:hypothetical protein